MKIDNVKIYDMEESLIASGYPMSLDTSKCYIDMTRGCNLGNTPTGSGHGNFLSGIRVSFDITYSQYFSMQLQRYSFLDIVSSQSKMHRILKMDIRKQCNHYVRFQAVENLQNCIDIYNLEPTQDNFMVVISNIPMGLELTMRVSTNYLQLKTIYQQRKNHKLTDWKYFCDWILTLDNFKELCLNSDK